MDIYQRFHTIEPSCYWVGHHAQQRIALARAEAWLDDQDDLQTITEPDPEPWDGDAPAPFELVIVAIVRPCPEHGIDCKHTVWCASLGSVGLTGHTRTDTEYLRTIRAELAAELMPQQSPTP